MVFGMVKWKRSQRKPQKSFLMQLKVHEHGPPNTEQYLFDVRLFGLFGPNIPNSEQQNFKILTNSPNSEQA